jgi:DNA modification methylase
MEPIKSRIPASLESLTVDVETLSTFPSNPRQGDVGAICESLKQHGQYRPIVVNRRTMEVLAGNHTLQAARALGWGTVAATFVDVDDETAKRIVLVDNRSNDLASYDDSALAEMLRSLPDLTGTGYDGDDLNELLARLDGGRAVDDDVPPPPADPVTKPGDIIFLGEHRLLCGDSGDALALDRIYEGNDVGCVLTDPPYGINLDTDYRSMGTGSSKAVLRGTSPRAYQPIIGDSEPFDAAFLATYFAGVAEQFWFGADYYRRTLSESDLDGSWLVWDKRNESSDAGFGSGFELVWSKQRHKRDLLRHYYFGAFGVEGRDRVHPTQKPTPLLVEILNRWAPTRCVVVDPFLGSGSTLIACENTGRICLGVELDPGYCDVIVERWERVTGALAVRPSADRPTPALGPV